MLEVNQHNKADLFTEQSVDILSITMAIKFILLLLFILIKNIIVKLCLPITKSAEKSRKRWLRALNIIRKMSSRFLNFKKENRRLDIYDE